MIRKVLKTDGVRDSVDKGFPLLLYPFVAGVLLLATFLLTKMGQKLAAEISSGALETASIWKPLDYLQLLVLGGVFLWMSLRSVFYILRIQSLRKLERKSARVSPTYGKLHKVRHNKFLYYYDSHCYSLVVTYEDTSGKTHKTVSEPVWEQPFVWKENVRVPLHIDRADPKRAWVLVSEYYNACKGVRP